MPCCDLCKAFWTDKPRQFSKTFWLGTVLYFLYMYFNPIHPIMLTNFVTFPCTIFKSINAWNNKTIDKNKILTEECKNTASALRNIRNNLDLFIYDLVLRKKSRWFWLSLLLTTILEAHHVYSILKRRGNSCFHVVATGNTRGVFVGNYILH